MGNRVTLLKPPAYAPGHRVANALRSGIYAIRSEDVVHSETSPIVIFSVPRNTMVFGVVAEILQGFNGTTPAVAVGDAGLATRFLNSTSVGSVGVLQSFTAFEYASDTDIRCTLTLVGATTGRVRFTLLVRFDTDRPQ